MTEDEQLKEQVQQSLLQTFGEELGEWVELKNSTQQMIETKGWKLFTEMLDNQHAQRAARIAGPPTEVTDRERTYLAGEMAGITLAREFLGNLNATAAEMITMIQEMDAAAQEEEKETEDGDG